MPLSLSLGLQLSRGNGREGGGGIASPALIAHTLVTPGANNGGTSPAIDTTGSTLLVCGTSISHLSTSVVSDSKSNTWIALTRKDTSTSQTSQIFYCFTPTVGTNHTFTIGPAGGFETMCIATFSGLTAFDKQSGNVNDGVASTIKPGALTPTAINSLVITAVGMTTLAGAASIDGGFIISDQIPFNSGLYFGTGLAYILQTSIAAADPTWTVPSSTNQAATMAVFK